MIEERYNHAAVSSSNKLFVIGGRRNPTCEVFHSHSRRFCYIKVCTHFSNEMDFFQAVCIRNQIVVFGENRTECETKVCTYNVATTEWKPFDCSILKDKYFINCIKYPQ